MLTFVETTAHPALAQLTEAYLRLQLCEAAARKANSDERRAAKELADLPAELKKQNRDNGCARSAKSSGEIDLSDPENNGYSAKFIERALTYASALLAARADYESLYEAVRVLQALVTIDGELKAYHALRSEPFDERAPAWVEEALSVNAVCARQLLAQSLQTLDSFSAAVFDDYKQVPLLDRDVAEVVRAFNYQSRNWVSALPPLPPADGHTDLSERRLLIRYLVAADNAHREGNGWFNVEELGAYWDRVYFAGIRFGSNNAAYVMDKVASVLSLLKQVGWVFEQNGEGRVSRPGNTHLPFLRSGKQRRFWQR